MPWFLDNRRTSSLDAAAFVPGACCVSEGLYCQAVIRGAAFPHILIHIPFSFAKCSRILPFAGHSLMQNDVCDTTLPAWQT